MEKKSIGSNISILRKRHGLTQKQLAEKLGVTDKTVSRWERNETEPDLASISRLADIFGVPTDGLLRGAEYGLSEINGAAQHTDEKANTRAIISDMVAVALPVTGTIIATVFSFVIEPGIRTGDLAGVNFRVVGFFTGLLFYIAAAILKAAQTIRLLTGLPNSDETQAFFDRRIDMTISYCLFFLTSLTAAAATMFAVPFFTWLLVCSLCCCATLLCCTLLSWYLIKPYLAKANILSENLQSPEIHALRRSAVIYYSIAAVILLWHAAAFGFYDEFYFVAFIFCFIPLTVLAAVLYQIRKRKLLQKK